jgi:hypothetical protein
MAASILSLPPPDPELLAKAMAVAEASQSAPTHTARRQLERQAIALWIAAQNAERRMKRGRTQ